MNKSLLLFLAVLISGCAKMQTGSSSKPSPDNEDAAFAKLSDEYISGYLDWRPQTGTSLGFHQYDGKVTDFSRASLEGELTRLKSFDKRLGALDVKQLSKTEAYDYRILGNTIKREIFVF